MGVGERKTSESNSKVLVIIVLKTIVSHHYEKN